MYYRIKQDFNKNHLQSLLHIRMKCMLFFHFSIAFSSLTSFSFFWVAAFAKISSAALTRLRQHGELYPTKVHQSTLKFKLFKYSINTSQKPTKKGQKSTIIGDGANIAYSSPFQPPKYHHINGPLITVYSSPSLHLSTTSPLTNSIL